ncbi:hypothetical protein B0H11DRAFT_2404494 [Mycena galericulata]|nr:hypothetical protein B0H11DRAFT_2404494 [Mycena galericulata]
MRHPVILILTIFTSLILGAIVTIIFTISFKGPLTENEVYRSAGEQDGMLVSWQPAGCGKYFARTEPSYGLLNGGTGSNCGRPSVNVCLAINGAPSWCFDPSQDPFQGDQSLLYANHILAKLRPLILHKKHSIAAQFSMFFKPSFRLNPNAYVDLQFVYPFDAYRSSNTFVAFTPSQDGSTSNSTFLPILYVAAVDASETFVPAWRYTLPPIAHARIFFNGMETDNAYVFTLIVKRSLLAKVFTVTLFFINWGLVACVCYITIVAWISRDRKAGQWVLAIPVTIILTIPGLRALFVGNPSFGLLTPWMIIVCICALALVLKVGAMKKSDVNWSTEEDYKSLKGHSSDEDVPRGPRVATEPDSSVKPTRQTLGSGSKAQAGAASSGRDPEAPTINVWRAFGEPHTWVLAAPIPRQALRQCAPTPPVA